MPRSNRARNNFFFGKKEPVVSRVDYWPWLQQAAKSVPYAEGQVYLVHFPDLRGKWVWYYVSYPSERAIDEASESTLPVRLIRDENPWTIVRLNMQSSRHPEELSLLVLDAKSQMVVGPLSWSEIETKRNPRQEQTPVVDIAYAIRRTQANILKLRDVLQEQGELLARKGLSNEAIDEALRSSKEGQQLDYEFNVLMHLQATEALRRAFGPKREREETRANPNDDDETIRKQRALIRRLEQQLKERAALLEYQGLRLSQIRDVLLNDELTLRVREERAILDRLTDAARLARVFRHARGAGPVAESNPALAAVGSIAAQVATSIVLNLGVDTWKKVTAMSVAERAVWLDRTAQKASWLTGVGGLIYKHAPVGEMRHRAWLEISQAMSSPDVQHAVQDAVQDAVALQNPQRAQPESHYKHFLKPSTRSWPIWRRDTGYDHARVAIQFMLRGFGNKREYPALIHRMAELIPPSDPMYAHIWEFYSQNRADIARTAQQDMPSIERLVKRNLKNKR